MKEDNVIETVVQLMRLTRENKIKWKRIQGNELIPWSIFSGRLDELEFELREVVSPEAKDVLNPLAYFADSLNYALSHGFSLSPVYRLTVKDNRTSEEIVFPLSQGVNDLGAIVADKVDNVKAINSINERLKAL